MTVPTVYSSAIPSPSLPPDVQEDLRRYAQAGGFTLRAESHPWYAALDRVTSQEEARAASTVLAEVRGRDLPVLRDAAERLAAVPGLTAPATAGGTAEALALLQRVRDTLAALRPEAYEADLDELVAATASGAWRAEQGVKQSWFRRQGLVRRARALAAAKATRDELHRALRSAAADREAWAALAGGDGRPVLPADHGFLDEAGQAAEAATSGLRELSRLLAAQQPLADAPLTDVAELLDALASDEGTLHRLPRLHELRDSLTAAGLTDLLADLTSRHADPADVDALLSPTEPPAAAAPETTADASEADGTSEAVAESVSLAATELPATAAPESTADVPEADTEAPEAEADAEIPEAETQAPEPTAVGPASPTAPAEAEAPEAQTEAPKPADDTTPEAAAEPSAPAAPVETDAPEAETDAPDTSTPEAAEPTTSPAADTAEAAAPEAATDVPEQAEDITPEAAAEPSAPAEPQAESSAPTTDAPSDAAPAVEPAAEPEPEPEPAAASEPAPARTRRPRKPDVVPGRPVTAYSAEQLEALVRWLDSDSVERSDDELLRAAMKELGFSRLGPRIKEALGAAVTAARS